jgi:Na+-transporting NADH:ubiquinone oxidoreductase subunit C
VSGDAVRATRDAGLASGTWRNRLASMPNDSLAKTVAVAFLVALLGSVLVSTAAVLLRPRIEANLEQERQRHLLEIVQRLPGIEALFDRAEEAAIEAFVVDLATGAIDRSLRPEDVDARAAAQDLAGSIAIPRDRDLAGLRRVSRYHVVYLVQAENELLLILLPVYGQGFASTLYGYLGLAGDANTVVGLAFYEHGETPGLGAQVDSPQWRDQWPGRMARDPEGRLRIGVARSPLAPGDPDAPYQVDGVTGATFTSQGVHNLLRFWLGDDGFGPFLGRMEQTRGLP